MKKKIILGLILFAITLCQTIIIYAAGEKVQFKETNQENTITIEITSSEKIGVIEGNISHDAGISQVKVSSSYNGWTATYNEETGKFNAFKAEGTNNEEVLQITYQLNSNSSQGTIEAKDINLTTISYKTIEVENIRKTIQKVNNTIANNNATTDNTRNSSVTKSTEVSQKYGSNRKRS